MQRADGARAERGDRDPNTGTSHLHHCCWNPACCKRTRRAHSYRSSRHVCRPPRQPRGFHAEGLKPFEGHRATFTTSGKPRHVAVVPVRKWYLHRLTSGAAPNFYVDPHKPSRTSYVEPWRRALVDAHAFSAGPHASSLTKRQRTVRTAFALANSCISLRLPKTCRRPQAPSASLPQVNRCTWQYMCSPLRSFLTNQARSVQMWPAARAQVHS